MSDVPKQICDGLVWSGFHNVFCGRKAGYEHEGRHFCKTHHPPSMKERSDKSFQLYKEKWEKIAAARTASETAADEMAQNAARYLWLRDRVPGSAYRAMGVIYSEAFAGIDVAIDAAMSDTSRGER